MGGESDKIPVDVDDVIDNVLMVMPDEMTPDNLISMFIAIIYAYSMDDNKDVFGQAFLFTLMNSERVSDQIH